MSKIRRIYCFVCAVFWAVSLSTASTDHHSGRTKHCARVQHEFVHQKIGESSIVPDNPIYDADISICFNGAQHVEKGKKSCCSRESELHYAVAAERFLRDSIRSQNSYLKKLVMDHMSHFEEMLREMLHNAGNSTQTLLSDTYKIPTSEHHAAVHSFFHELDQYVGHQYVSIFGVVSKFFDDIFPVVFRYIINDPSVSVITDEYRKCLVQKRPEFLPQPFGNVPFDISQTLNRAMSVSRSYLEALNVVVEAVNVTDKVHVQDTCKEAVTRLQFCSHCRGYVDVKPCQGFCRNVMRGCLAKLVEIGPEWNDVITAIKSLVWNMQGSSGAEEILQVLDRKISDAIMHAMDQGPKFYKSIVEKCGHPLTGSKDNKGPSGPTIDVKHSPRKALSSKMYMEAEQVAQLLLESKGLYSNLADNVCKQGVFYDQDFKSHDVQQQCWNGSDVAAYRRSIPEAHLINQAKHNAEVKVTLVPDKKLLELKDKLHHLKRTLRTKVTDTSEIMLSDDPKYNIEGSGLSHGKGFQLSDDEDFDGSGSGSGDSSTEVVIPAHGKHKDKKYGIKPSDKENKNSQDGFHFTTDMQKDSSASVLGFSHILLVFILVQNIFYLLS